ncbi:hypothetical protein VSR01_16560 [Actinacidiphila sp. DG2A-62]|uniref:hypothetical protein n=1 Tax=Actinacidiphila sp. DG2A-62 TaxID=3108821 RepID=UPI002DB97430|nr:hypothetical protein [Actinacidiphila sp. DG2A-62]MEC3995059.1 hypothetical protein [Actinacidiphila sp. DG2A-62]
MSRAARIKRGPIAADVLGRNFTQVFNAAVRDRRLSRRARGLLVELLSHRDGYGVSIERLIEGGPEGRDAIRAALAELERYGYLHRRRERDLETGRLGEAVYLVSDMPEGLDLQEAAPWPAEESDEPDTPENSTSGPTSDFPTLAEPTWADPPPKKTNSKKIKKTEDQAAPPARSADDVRRTTTGSSARDEFNGSAATETPDPVAAESEQGHDGGPVADAPRGKVPGPRGGRKPNPFPADVRHRIYATEALLPAPLRAALAVILPHGHLPNVNRQVTAQALQTRTPEQLAERAARRWISYGYERDHFDGVLRSPIGVVEELLRPTPYCPAPECEDGMHVLTGQPCTPCSERVARRKRDRKAGRVVPTHRPPRLYRDREQCDVCDRPFPGNVPDDRLCGLCRAELDRGAAFLLGIPAVDEPDNQDDADPYMPTAPNDEYRQWRADHAAAKTAQFEDLR